MVYWSEHITNGTEYKSEYTDRVDKKTIRDETWTFAVPHSTTQYRPGADSLTDWAMSDTYYVL